MSENTPINEESIFYTEAIYGSETRKPLVTVLIGKTTMTVTPDEARAMADSLSQTAFAAEADAFLIDWLTSKVDVPVDAAVQILRDFRVWRVEQNGSRTGGAD